MKRIVIIGAGISGLSALHFLKKKFENRLNVEIVLLEKESFSGGTIATLKNHGVYFEIGPNGFLDNKPRTFDLIRDLGIEDQLLKASDRTSLRYIVKNNNLEILPTTPQTFFSSNLLSLSEKLRVPLEYFVKKGDDPHETIYSFGRRRLGEGLTNIFLDAMVSGIYAGDIKEICIKGAFPRIYQLEQQYGSLFKALKEIKKAKKGVSVMPKSGLYSFRNGMQTLTETLTQKYKSSIVFNQQVRKIEKNNDQYMLQTQDKTYNADHVIFSTPAYQLAKLIETIDVSLSEDLEKIDYVPVVVLGLAFRKKDLGKIPQGFGYLIPSSQKSKVLGVLFEHDIFPEHVHLDFYFFRVMMGGAHNRDILKYSQDELIEIAIENLKNNLKVKINTPEHQFIKIWPKAIAQYNKHLMETNERLDAFVAKNKQIKFAANYYHGVSMNDCIENAFAAAAAIDL